jgi:hypothetical protein
MVAFLLDNHINYDDDCPAPHDDNISDITTDTFDNLLINIGQKDQFDDVFVNELLNYPFHWSMALLKP